MIFSTFITKKLITNKKYSNFFSLVSIISIGGISLGVAVLIITLSILDGFDTTVKEKIMQFNSHVEISGFHRANLAPPDKVIPYIQKKIGKITQSVSPFVSKAVIIRSSKSTEGILINGIENDYFTQNISRYLIKDNHQYFNNYGILIGNKLAEKLKVTINDKILVMGLNNDQLPSYDNPPVIFQFVVSGIYESGMADYDDLIAYIDLKTAQDIFNQGDQVSGYNIKLKNYLLADSVSVILSEDLPYPYYVRSYKKINPNIFTWLELQKKPIPVILGLIIIVAVFNIVGTLLIQVIEKTYHIGVLKTLGCTNRQIQSIFFLKGTILSVIGIIAGNILALLLVFLQYKFQIISIPSSVYFVSKIPMELNVINFLIVDLITIVISLFSVIVPSRIASKLNIIKSIKFV